MQALALEQGSWFSGGRVQSCRGLGFRAYRDWGFRGLGLGDVGFGDLGALVSEIPVWVSEAPLAESGQRGPGGRSMRHHPPLRI